MPQLAQTIDSVSTARSGSAPRRARKMSKQAGQGWELSDASHRMLSTLQREISRASRPVSVEQPVSLLGLARWHGRRGHIETLASRVPDQPLLGLRVQTTLHDGTCHGGQSCDQAMFSAPEATIQAQVLQPPQL